MERINSQEVGAMKAAVVYESMYGNTHRVAEAVSEGLASLGEVMLLAVGEARPERLADVDLLVVGGPTHVHGMSRASSRQAAVEAAEAAEDVALDAAAPGPGLREWFDGLPRASNALGAAFDTRIGKPVLLTGSAAKGIAKALRRHGYRSTVQPGSFVVDGSEGPLADGELQRARDWAVALAEHCERVRQRA